MRTINTQEVVNALSVVDGSKHVRLAVERSEINKLLTTATASAAVEIARDCPNPKREDIYKLLAIQAYCMNEHGLTFLQMARTSEMNKPFYVDAGLKLIKDAKNTFLALLKDPEFDKKLIPNQAGKSDSFQD